VTTAGPSGEATPGATPDTNTQLRDFSGLIALIGAGKMGGALLEGWLRLGLDPRKVAVLEPQPLPHIAALAGRGVRLNPDAETLRQANVVVIAIKPQAADEALSALAANISSAALIVSIMAGRTLPFLSSIFPQNPAIVRAMPNLPAAIGRGITVAVAAKADTPQRQVVHQVVVHQVAHRLLGAIGAVEWVDDERLMDAVTALSGSGPAYVFLLAEALAQAGVAVGLPANLAETLARETIAGSGELLHQSRQDAASLRQNVTSPGGTTAAALAVLMRPAGLVRLMSEAIAAATARSRELAG
jgi:pyrroline-5-carboxylate reductase